MESGRSPTSTAAGATCLTLAWLDRLTKSLMLETCLVLGTLREPPKLPERVGSVWLGMNAE